MNKKKLLGLTIPPILILAGLLIAPLSILSNGEEVTILSKPTYTTYYTPNGNSPIYLEYKIEEVSKLKIEKTILDNLIADESDSFERKGYKVYSILKQNENGIYDVEKVVSKKPDSGIYLIGRIPIYSFMEDDEFVQIFYDMNNEYYPKLKPENEKEIAVKAKIKNGQILIIESGVK